MFFTPALAEVLFIDPTIKTDIHLLEGESKNLDIKVTNISSDTLYYIRASTTIANDDHGNDVFTGDKTDSATIRVIPSANCEIVVKGGSCDVYFFFNTDPQDQVKESATDWDSWSALFTSKFTYGIDTAHPPDFYQVGPAFKVTVSDVPEPSTWALMLVGLTGLGVAGYRRSGAVRIHGV
jgi:hypothetical protein